MAISNSVSGEAAKPLTHCPRCAGLLFAETFDGRDDYWWRCLMCGNILDQTILDNRSKTLTDFSQAGYRR